MASDVATLLARWVSAGLIDEETASRIRVFEGERVGSAPARLRWPILVALAFGALMVASGVLLFVSAHWDALSPGARFALALVLVAAFHVAGASLAERFPGMASALHATGTVTLGAGIYLAGQIFNLDEHWPGGLMMWALGAAIGAWLLADSAQFALVAILAPAWLVSEWLVATNVLGGGSSAQVLASGVFLLALAYLTARADRRTGHYGRVLLWLGGVATPPAAGLLALALNRSVNQQVFGSFEPSGALLVFGWTVALGLPTLVAFLFKRTAAWPNVLAVIWVLALLALHRVGAGTLLYVWWAVGATALVAWGVREGRRERIDMGAAIFAVTVFAFYFSEVMDKLERSASLVGLGLLFLAGGWGLDRVRRRLIQHVRGPA